MRWNIRESFLSHAAVDVNPVEVVNQVEEVVHHPEEVVNQMEVLKQVMGNEV